MLHILRHTPEWVLTNGVVTDSRKRQLSMLAGGSPWRYMERHFFPSLRCSHLRVYTDGPLQAATDGAAIPCPVQDTIYIERERSVSPSAAIAFAPEMQPADSAATRALSSVGLPADTVVPLHASSGRPLYLHTLYADTIASASRTGEVDAPAPVRALPVGADNFYGTFGVSAYAYTGDWSDDCTPNYMYDVAVAPSGKLWASANTYYWPGSACRLRFFAYAPRGNAAYTFSGADAAGAPTLRCVIPAGAKIEILFNDGTEDHLLTASIGCTLWPMGKTVTYRISTTSINWVYTLEAKGPRPYSFRGEYDEYAVTSYRTHVVTGQQEPVAWSETYSLDGGKSWTDVPPRWTNGFVGSGGRQHEAPVLLAVCPGTDARGPQRGGGEADEHTAQGNGGPSVEPLEPDGCRRGGEHGELLRHQRTGALQLPPCLRQRHPQRSRQPGSLQFHQHQPLRAQAVRQLHQLSHHQALHRRGLCLPADVGGNPVAGRAGTGDGRPLSRRAGPGHHLVCRPPGDHQGGECGHRAEGRTRAGHLVVAHLGDFCRRGADHPREDVPREGSIRARLRVHAGQPRLVRDGRSGVSRVSMCRPSRHSPAVRS